jgi:uncharacterized protein (TIGR02271 family)
MATLQKDRIRQLRGETLYDRDGEKIGQVHEIYLDTGTGEPEWALVSTGLFGNKSTFVPLAGVTETGQGFQAAHDKATVKDAPRIEPNGQLSRSEEAELYRHYGLEYRDSDTGTGTTGRDDSGPTTDDAMTRSEEELRVGTAEREAGRVRLRKYVVTDEETRTVPVKREEVRLEREPITEANRGAALDGPAISDEEHEVVLHEEEVVTEKRAVPKERVRLGKDVQVDERTVTEDVRRERIELDDERR